MDGTRIGTGDVGLAEILDAGLVPIIEPEVDIHAPDKAEAEDLLVAELTRRLDALDEGRDVAALLRATLRDVGMAGAVRGGR